MSRDEVPALTVKGSYLVNDKTGCWLWAGKIGPRGYGYVGSNRRAAHRVSFEEHVGPIAEGLVIDHLCRNKLCVNPAHLEPVTPKENTLRGSGPSAMNILKTHCPKGHEYSAENTFLRSRGRDCRTCENLRTKLAKRKARLEARQKLEAAHVES